MIAISEDDKKELIKDVLSELRRQKIIVKNRSVRDNTERLLRDLNKLKKSIDKIEKQIVTLEKEERKLKPKIAKTNRVVLKDKDRTYFYTDETLETRINELKQSKIRVQTYVEYVESILEEFKENEYYPIIEWIYFENKTQKDISEFFGWADSTITKHKYILLEQLSSMLFPDNFIKDING